MLKNVSLCFMVGVMVCIIVTAAGAEPSKELMVSAGISLKEVFQKIGKLYESKNAGIKVVFDGGGSGELARQIESGAPADVFASAARKDMEQLIEKGLVIASSKTDFAQNSMVLIKPDASRVQIKSFEDLIKPEIRKIAIGNPQTVPAGRYAQEVLTHFKLWDGIKDKLVFAENVKQVLNYVSKNEADAGIVYSTDALFIPEVRIIAKANRESHQPILYSIGIVKDSKNEASAKAFIALILSEEGMKILQKSGFEPIRK